MRNEAELLRAQRETGQPWSIGWNRLLGSPGSPGVIGRAILAAVMIFSSIANGVLRLTPALESPSGTLWLIMSIVMTALLPIGLLYAWSAVRLHRHRERLVDGES